MAEYTAEYSVFMNTTWIWLFSGEQASGSQEEEDRERGGDRDADRETAWRVK